MIFLISMFVASMVSAASDSVCPDSEVKKIAERWFTVGSGRLGKRYAISRASGGRKTDLVLAFDNLFGDGKVRTWLLVVGLDENCKVVSATGGTGTQFQEFETP